MDLTSEQIRAARALIRWEQKDLALASGISLPSIKRLETIAGPLAAQARTIEALRTAMENAGVEFIEGGVRERPGINLPRLKVPILQEQIEADEEGRSWGAGPDGDPDVQ